MTVLRSAALALLLATATAACAETLAGSGVAATQSRPVTGFRGVGLSVPAKLEIVQGEREALTLSGDDNVLAVIETVVEKGTLKVRYQDRAGLRVRPKLPLRILLTARAMEAIAVAGSGEVNAAALDTPKLAVSISGSGDVALAGRAQTFDISISGSGDVKAGRFETQRTNVSIAGSGDAQVWARESLRASIAGSGDVRYYGDAQLSTSIVGSGNVRRVGPAPG